LPGRGEALDLLAQSGHPGVDATPIEFDLRLSRPPAAHSCTRATHLPTGLARHRLTPATQTRKQVLELGQLNLRLALSALGVLAEDVEDHRGAVDDLDLDDVFERTALARCQLTVDHDGVGSDSGHDVAQLCSLALSEVGARVGSR